MSDRRKMLIILVDESDTWGEHPLYEGITRRLERLEAPGAMVQAGIMGFGSHHRIHRKRLFGVSDDRPVSITVVAEESLLREKVIPGIRPMVAEGLILLLDVEVIF
jgi:PII-like signaling protein